jgi:hypothetical protein
MIATESFVVPVLSSGMMLEAVLEPALQSDMPMDWRCNWPLIWRNSDFDCQAIVKLSVGTTLWGLIRYGLYPYPFPASKAAFVDIENLEAHSSRVTSEIAATKRLAAPPSRLRVSPVGKWLMWHACDMALRSCTNSKPLVTLIALPGAVDYYRDNIGMSFAGVATAAPGEDGYAFTFEKSEATAFCQRIQTEYGDARRIDRE